MPRICYPECLGLARGTVNSKVLSGTAVACGGQADEQHPEELDADGARIMSKRVVQRICRERGCAVSPECCTALYLHQCQFKAVAGLDEFTSVKVLHLEGNCLVSCDGLGHMASLRALYLQSNDLGSVTGLATCTQLVTLNISSNPLNRLLPGAFPPSLLTLHASGTGLSDPSDIAVLAQDCPNLQVLDLQHNPELRSPELLQELCGLSNLRVLYMQGCPVVHVPNYRRTLVARLPRLSYLDDSPVDDVERAGAEAWLVGGREAEQAARMAWRDEKRRALKRTTVSFAVERARRRMARQLGDAGVAALAGSGAPLAGEDTAEVVRRLVDVPALLAAGVVPVGALSEQELDSLLPVVPFQPHTAGGVGNQPQAAGNGWQPHAAANGCQSHAAGTCSQPLHAEPQRVGVGRECTPASVPATGASGHQPAPDTGICEGSGAVAQAAEAPSASTAPSRAPLTIDLTCLGSAASAANTDVLPQQQEQQHQQQTAGLVSDTGVLPHLHQQQQESLHIGPVHVTAPIQPVERTECAVCSEELQEGDPVVLLSCSHIFHGPCLRSWVRMGGLDPTCPLCRASVLPPAAQHRENLQSPSSNQQQRYPGGARSGTRSAGSTPLTSPGRGTTSAWHIGNTSPVTGGAGGGYVAARLSDVLHRASPTRPWVSCVPEPTESQSQAVVPQHRPGTAAAPPGILATAAGAAMAGSAPAGGTDRLPGTSAAPTTTRGIYQQLMAAAAAAGLAVPCAASEDVQPMSYSMTPNAAQPGSHSTSPSHSNLGSPITSQSPSVGPSPRSLSASGTSPVPGQRASTVPAQPVLPASTVPAQLAAARTAGACENGGEQAGAGSVTGEASHTSAGGRLYEKDGTYAKIQEMYRRNFGARSRDAEAQLAGWARVKQARLRDKSREHMSVAGGTIETGQGSAVAEEQQPQEAGEPSAGQAVALPQHMCVVGAATGEGQGSAEVQHQRQQQDGELSAGQEGAGSHHPQQQSQQQQQPGLEESSAQQQQLQQVQPDAQVIRVQVPDACGNNYTTDTSEDEAPDCDNHPVLDENPLTSVMNGLQAKGEAEQHALSAAGDASAAEVCQASLQPQPQIKTALPPRPPAPAQKPVPHQAAAFSPACDATVAKGSLGVSSSVQSVLRAVAGARLGRGSSLDGSGSSCITAPDAAAVSTSAPAMVQPSVQVPQLSLGPTHYNRTSSGTGRPGSFSAGDRPAEVLQGSGSTVGVVKSTSGIPGSAISLPGSLDVGVEDDLTDLYDDAYGSGGSAPAIPYV